MGGVLNNGTLKFNMVHLKMAPSKEKKGGKIFRSFTLRIQVLFAVQPLGGMTSMTSLAHRSNILLIRQCLLENVANRSGSGFGFHTRKQEPDRKNVRRHSTVSPWTVEASQLNHHIWLRCVSLNEIWNVLKITSASHVKKKGVWLLILFF